MRIIVSDSSCLIDLRKSSLLDALKGPSVVQGQTSSLLSTLKNPKVETDKHSEVHVNSSSLPRVTPSPASQALLFSPFKGSTLPPASDHQTSLLNALKSPPFAAGQTSSLLSPLKSSKAEMEKQPEVRTVKGNEAAKNVHVESLLRTLKSPSVFEKVSASITDPLATSTAESNTFETVMTSLINDRKSANPAETAIKPSPASMHISSLLSSLKGSGMPPNAPSPSNPPSPSVSTGEQQSTSLVAEQTHQIPVISPGTLNSSSPLLVKKSRPAQKSPPRANDKSPLDALKNPRTNGTSSTISPPATTSHERSLLSRLNPSKPSPPPTQTEAKPSSKGAQFDFSPAPQVGKRIKFRETLVPGGTKEFTPEPPEEVKYYGIIDLDKMTLLKRPVIETITTESTAVTNSSTTLEATSSDNKGKVHPEKGAITVLKRPVTGTAPSKESTEHKPESPLGIEYAFRKRTPSKSSRSSPTPSSTPTKAPSQSLLALLKVLPPEVPKETTPIETKSETGGEKGKSLDILKPPLKGEDCVASSELEGKGLTLLTTEPVEVESLGTEKELKLIALLERALARGVPL